jgi:hypothetical protein
MKQFRGYFHPSFEPRVTGFNKQGGSFFIGYIDEEDDSIDGQIRIELTVWADISPSKSTYASIQVYHDGVKVMRELDKLGFLDMFEEIQASNFYDVVQCCERCGIPIMYHDNFQNDFRQMTPRKIYDILYADTDTSS